MMSVFLSQKTGLLFRRKTGLLLSVLLALAMIPVLPAAAAENSCQDVKETDWFYDPVMYVCDKGLMKGTSSHTFEPYVDMSRAMLVTVLFRMEGEPEAAASAFGDVEKDSWFTDAVGWASASGIVKGMSETVRECHIPPQVIYSDGPESSGSLIVRRLSYVFNEKEKDLW